MQAICSHRDSRLVYGSKTAISILIGIYITVISCVVLLLWFWRIELWLHFVWAEAGQ
jgi:hypothetical protein